MVLLPAPGGPVNPIRRALPVRGWSEPRISSKSGRWFSTMLTTRASAAGLRASKSSSRRSEDAGKDLLLTPPHRRSGARHSGRMLVSKDVQSAVHHQSQKLLSASDALPFRVGASDIGTNVDISDHRTT